MKTDFHLHGLYKVICTYCHVFNVCNVLHDTLIWCYGLWVASCFSSVSFLPFCIYIISFLPINTFMLYFVNISLYLHVPLFLLKLSESLSSLPFSRWGKYSNDKREESEILCPSTNPVLLYPQPQNCSLIIFEPQLKQQHRPN